jgi:peroxin-3
LAEQVLSTESLNVEALTDKIKAMKLSTLEVPEEEGKRQRAAKWEQVKLMTLTRTWTSIYVVVTLVLLVKVQLNVLARYTYLDSLDALEDSHQFVATESIKHERPTKMVPFQVEKQFLAMSWHFLNRSVAMISAAVEKQVRKVASDLPLSKKLSLQDLHELSQQLRLDLVESHEEIVSWMLPAEGEEMTAIVKGQLQVRGDQESSPSQQMVSTEMDPLLQKLIEELRDHLQSPDFRTVMATSVEQISQVMQHQFEVELGAPDGMKPLAILLPIISRQAHLLVNGHPNIYVQALADHPTLHAYAAVIYSSFYDQ